MPYDQKLAARVRARFSDRDVAERPMFGGLTFMLGGHMCCGVNRDELIVRLHPAEEDAALARPHARPMDFTRRPMRGFVTIAPDGLKGQALNRWVGRAVAYAETLPPKQKPGVAHEPGQTRGHTNR
jgi:TfoX/Sxy family transcriptional regulator of competence genes